MHRGPHGVVYQEKARRTLHWEQLGVPPAATQGTTSCTGAARCAEDGTQSTAYGGRPSCRAEVGRDLACWTGSLRKQAPTCYTSARQHASRCETGTRWHWDQGSALAHAAKGHHGHSRWPTGKAARCRKMGAQPPSCLSSCSCRRAALWYGVLLTTLVMVLPSDGLRTWTVG